jgi:hypothetical protein
MKYTTIICLLLSLHLSSSQSVLTLGGGTSLGVTTGADLCANILNGSGIFYGGGTFCGGLVGILLANANELPLNFALSQNYPNPFNPTTTIMYQLPEFSNVKLSLYDIIGREVVLLVNGNQPAGYYGVVLDASGLASGVYIYRIDTKNFTKSLKMSVIK